MDSMIIVILFLGYIVIFIDLFDMHIHIIFNLILMVLIFLFILNNLYNLIHHYVLIESEIIYYQIGNVNIDYFD